MTVRTYGSSDSVLVLVKTTHCFRRWLGSAAHLIHPLDSSDHLVPVERQSMHKTLYSAQLCNFIEGDIN